MRLAGQDTRRGTFSQRHGVLVDQVDRGRVRAARPPRRRSGAVHALRHRALRSTRRSASSTATRSSSDALVCWEAQFGDFANAAQVVIDQFIVAAADKWGQRSRLSLLLPHGFEGQGPSTRAPASSATSRCAPRGTCAWCTRRPPRSTSTCCGARRSPPSRCRSCASPRSATCACRRRAHRSRNDLTAGAFELVLDDPRRPRTYAACWCAPARSATSSWPSATRSARPVAIVRVEQLFPWPETELLAILDRYPDATQVWWVQEEPANMGAWTFVRRPGCTVAARPGRSSVTRPSASAPGKRKLEDPRPRAARPHRRRLRGPLPGVNCVVPG